MGTKGARGGWIRPFLSPSPEPDQLPRCLLSTGSAATAPPHYPILRRRAGVGRPHLPTAGSTIVAPPPPPVPLLRGWRVAAIGRRTPPPPSPAARALHSCREGGDGRGGSFRRRTCPPPEPTAEREEKGYEVGRERERARRGGSGVGVMGERWVENKRERVSSVSIFANGWVKCLVCENILIFSCGYFKQSIWKN